MGHLRVNDGKYHGEIVFMFAYDVAQDMKRVPIQQLLGQPVEQFIAGIDKHGPKQAFFFQPQMVQLPPTEMTSTFGIHSVRRVVKIFPVGAISISISVPFAVEAITELVNWHDLRLDGRPIQEHAMTLAKKVQEQLVSVSINPTQTLGVPEEYTVFCVHSLDEEFSSEEWIKLNRNNIASVLNEETDNTVLSEQECQESTSVYISYHKDDLAIIDWDSAFVINRPENVREVLHIIELANVQLAELEIYDRYLDDALDKSYRDLQQRKASRRLDEIRQTRVDMARLSDELSNITKFFGDWYLARVYKGLSERFHLNDWQKMIDEKLKTLDNLYMILKQDKMNHWMLILEITIVLLFVLDVVLLVAGKV
jgi:hypothetical protein